MRNYIGSLRSSRLRKALDIAVKSASYISSMGYDSSGTILLSGTGRSGTTWVSEMICSSDGIEMIYEPFCGKERLKKHNIRSFDLYLDKGKIENKQYMYIKNLINKRNISIDNIKENDRILSVISADRILIKCIHGNRLMPFIEKEFGIKSILLVRHPCAVVSSQIRYKKGWNEEVVKYVESGKASDEIKKGIEKGNYESLPQKILLELDRKMGGLESRLETVEELLAFEWVCDLLVPMCQGYEDRCVVTYEDLVNRSKKEIKKIFRHIEKNDEKKAYKKINKPSYTTQQESNVAKGKNPLTTWKENLEKRQVKKILKFVHDAGIKIYDEGLIPIRKEVQRMLCKR